MPIIAGLISIIGFIFLLIIGLIGIVALFIRGGFKAAGYESKFRHANSKYSNTETAKMIASGQIWTGQTSEQLRDSKGEPESIYSVNDGETIWSYEGGLRVTLRDDKVLHW
jgi:hypothetical protein